ncbi:hypothetical protein EVAR_94061_1 [Eumeta japonica]|uniref:Uncharacterized protein n=1 Tax=Eumeta variegata TaxID=151549 RepID=A0A4C1V5F2_EUMVA|nr:hypothetical protein EVAR_94061_1 [Eumeta japonica]
MNLIPLAADPRGPPVALRPPAQQTPQRRMSRRRTHAREHTGRGVHTAPAVIRTLNRVNRRTRSARCVPSAGARAHRGSMLKFGLADVGHQLQANIVTSLL